LKAWRSLDHAVVPGAAPVARGPYRFVKRPNYWIVMLEIAVVPLALGQPLFALVFSLVFATFLLCASMSKIGRWLGRSPIALRRRPLPMKQRDDS